MQQLPALLLFRHNKAQPGAPMKALPVWLVQRGSTSSEGPLGFSFQVEVDPPQSQRNPRSCSLGAYVGGINQSIKGCLGRTLPAMRPSSTNTTGAAPEFYTLSQLTPLFFNHPSFGVRLIYASLPVSNKSVNYVMLVQRHQFDLLRQTWLKVCGLSHIWLRSRFFPACSSESVEADAPLWEETNVWATSPLEAGGPPATSSCLHLPPVLQRRFPCHAV